MQNLSAIFIFTVPLVLVELGFCCRLRTFWVPRILDASWHSPHANPCFDSASFPCFSIPFVGHKTKKKLVCENENEVLIWKTNCLFRITHEWFFRFKIVLLLDALDTATGRVASVFQCATSLFHTHNFGTSQTTQFQRSIQVPHRNGYQFIVTNIGNRTWRQWGLQFRGEYFLKLVSLFTSYSVHSHFFAQYIECTNNLTHKQHGEYFWWIHVNFTYHWTFSFAFLLVRHLEC